MRPVRTDLNGSSAPFHLSVSRRLEMNFLEHQSDINASMRSILIDWLIEVADEYKMTDETLFLSVQYVDRFLSTVNVTRSKLQLLGMSLRERITSTERSILGTTCLYLASKYEEMYPPALDEFTFITDNTYEQKHILRMEQIVIKVSVVRNR
jgi:cyclin-A